MTKRERLCDTARSIVGLYWSHNSNDALRAESENNVAERDMAVAKVDAFWTARKLIDLIAKGDERGLAEWYDGLRDAFEKTWESNVTFKEELK